jgi:1-acyl-sn-glycerol-3-phosphate acyltransferase
VKFYFKLALISIYLMIASIVCVVVCLIRWGDLNLDRFCGHTLGWGILKIAGWRTRVVSGSEFLKAPQPCIYMANHQSAMDVAIFGPICPERVVIIGKKEIRWIPFFGLVFEASGNIMIDRKNRTQAVAGLDQVTDAIKNKGASVFIFPEGTRNTSGSGILPLKKGAFYMAINAQVPLVPIVCSPLKPLVDPPARHFEAGQISVSVLPPISTQGLTSADIPRLMATAHQQMSEALSRLETRVESSSG